MPSDLTLKSGQEILIVSKDQSYLTHGIHKFPAKFFPELPRYLIARYSQEGDKVLDPFMGSGTTLLEAMLKNRQALGTDVDPIANLISRVKTTPINPKSLYKCKQVVFRQILEKVDSNYMPDIPEFNYRDKWFQSYVLRELAIIKESIDHIRKNGYSEAEAKRLHEFFSVVLSSIIRDVSNADPNCTRTVIRKNLKKHINEWDTTISFLTACDKQIEQMRELYDTVQNQKFKPKVRVIKADARRTTLKDESIDLAVTSPPYVNAVDYPRTHQLEMYWLNLVNGTPLSEVKRKYIGTETVYKEEYRDFKTNGYEKLNEIVGKIKKKDPRRAYIVQKFFDDMEDNLKEVYRVLKKGGRYCMVIGNNHICGHEVKSHEIIGST